MTHSGPEVLFKTCVAMKFVDDDDDDDDLKYHFYSGSIMSNFNSISSRVSEFKVAENRYLPLTGGIAHTTCTMTCYAVIKN